MGGKRPDQYQIDPADSGATDYKNLPQTGRGNSSLDDTVEIDRQKHAQSREEARHPQAPGRRPPPSRDANRPLRAQERSDDIGQELEGEPGAAQSDPSKGNPLV